MKKSYANGSDMLLSILSKAIGHCTSHSVTMNSETKDRAVKPVATAKMDAGLWKEKGIVGLSISISAEGLVSYDEAESGYAKLMAAWKNAEPVTVECFEREEDESPYLSGSFIISNLEMTAPAQDDVTYSISLENNGQPTILDDTKFTTNAEA